MRSEPTVRARGGSAVAYASSSGWGCCELRGNMLVVRCIVESVTETRSEVGGTERSEPVKQPMYMLEIAREV